MSGFNPIEALAPLTAIVPSSTRIPDGSVTIISFASSMRGIWVVRVTELGGMVREEPLIGEVVIKELLAALLIPT